MTRAWRTATCVLLTAALTGAACERRQSISTEGGTREQRRFEILLDWQPEPTYIGVYYADTLGAYERLGLDVTITPSWGANQAVSAVAGGRYRIATASGGATVLAYNSGAEIVSLAVIYPRVPSSVYGLATTPIRKPADLEGRRVGLYPGSITVNEFDAFVKANKLRADRIERVSISGADIPLLLSGKVDAVLNYTEMSPAEVEVNETLKQVDGRRTFEIPLKDYGVGGYGLNIVTSKQALSQEPQLLRAVASAMVEGYRQGCAHPERAVEDFSLRMPEKSRAYLTEGWRRVCGLVGADPGVQTAEGWEETIGVYTRLGLLQAPVAVASVMAR